MNSQALLSKVFLWMFFGLLVTFGTGYVVSMNPNMVINVLGGSGMFICVLVELALVIFLSARITKMQPTTAKISFILYSFVSGLTFSSVFVVYEITSVLYVFLITAVVFGILAFIGATTKIDLTRMGTYLFIALLAILICTLINLFLGSTTFDLIISVVTILVFLGFTAYDVQNILRLYESNMLLDGNLAIYGALDLYLDFINLFLQFIQFFGKSRD